MTGTATRARQFYTCTCDARPEPHEMPVQRIVVAPAADVDPVGVLDALTLAWYDTTLFFGPDVAMVVACEEGEETGAIEVAREWAAAHGFAVESYEGEAAAARVAPDGAPQAPGEGGPVYRYAA
ncbi:hypothetical protein K388_07464 [Streptomyces sp. KhCrAH-43]|uniref:hypothetical protein n=1 Tax=unclassified Streptomyces TaxID=2593676 RepID=UPI000373E411|nr:MULTISPECIES: hypothetical protein [unclassified Streptomyces]MYS37215.1 hypothetical protein [Streptomyces sp. SID4920]MYX67196.1 hypothetical protein [Streptomyces sp. SID8373]RAJ42996.1 hypothetical protein K388_07464 [Streptomyces sp. KhCrAH-43]